MTRGAKKAMETRAEPCEKVAPCGTEESRHKPVHVTKWAFTKGIFTVNARITEGDLASFRFRGFPINVRGKDWHQTEAEARVRVEEERQNRLRRLHAQMEKISALRVKVVDA